MAVLIANQTGNFTTAATWSTVDTSGPFPVAIATQETGTTTSTAAFVSSTAFTPGAITLDGIALKISSRSASPTGTFSIRLFNSTLAAAVAGTTVTCNTSDIPNGNGWIFFKFAAPVVLVALTNYTVQLTTSTASQVISFRKSATAADWTFALRTTTTAAPGAGDQMLVMSEITGAGAVTSITVTMNNTAAINFGPAVAGAAGLEISSNSTFTCGTAASTTYLLNLAGHIYINNLGTFNWGTSGTPVPITSTASLQIINTANVGFGIECRAGSTIRSGGATLTVNSAFLAADAATSATSLTSNVTTNWKSGDQIAIASTTRTRTEAEVKALTADASGTTLTITALTNAHSGTAPTRAELLNLTRSAKIFGNTTALQTYINLNATSTCDLQSTEFHNMGSNTAQKRGIEIGTTTGSCTINNCSMHDFVVTGSRATINNSGTTNNFTISNNVIYGMAAQGIDLATTSGTNYSVTNNQIMAFGQAASSTGMSIADLGGTITNNTCSSGQGNGFSFGEMTSIPVGTLSGFTSHSNSAAGAVISGTTVNTNNPMGTFSSFTVWRNNTTAGLQLSNSFNFIIDGVVAFGNNTANVHIGGTECDNVILNNMTLDAGTTLVCPVGVNLATDLHEVYIDNSTFGGTTTHATADINVSAANIFVRLVTRNTTLNSTTQVGSPTTFIEGSFIGLAKLNTTAGNHKMFKKFGTFTPDTTIFNRATPSTRLTPNSATQKLQGSVKKTAVPITQTAVLGVWVRKSVAGDGSAYNGNQPRIILKRDPAAGIMTDTVLATASGAAGTWEFISGTTPAITDNAVYTWYVDCDGTAGWVNVDDYNANS